MKKIFCLFMMLFSFSMAQAQTDKTSKKASTKTEKKDQMTAKSKDRTAKKNKDPQDAPVVRINSTEPAPNDTPASPGSNAGTNTPLDAPSNGSNASPANNGSGTPKQ